jgi:uncharacterized cupin superfamily protein
MHADEVDTDPALVGRLLAEQFPQWANLPIEPVRPTSIAWPRMAIEARVDSSRAAEKGRISAVIDWGGLGVGDPACDVMVVWTRRRRTPCASASPSAGLRRSSTIYHRTMDVPETPPQQTEDGLVPGGGGWFVLNVRDARWTTRPGRQSVSFTGKTEFESDTYFPMLGVQLAVLEPGEPNSMYHWETETEAFLVLSGEALLIVEGEERPLRQWDFVHCPPKTEHVVVGAGDGPCVLLAMSSRERQAFGPYGAYTVDEVARRHRACGDEETQDNDVAYARVPDAEWSRYRDGWLPDS